MNKLRLLVGGKEKNDWINNCHWSNRPYLGPLRKFYTKFLSHAIAFFRRFPVVLFYTNARKAIEKLESDQQHIESEQDKHSGIERTARAIGNGDIGFQSPKGVKRI